MKRKAMPVILVALLAISLCACGGGSSAPAASSQTDSSSQTSSSTASTSEPASENANLRMIWWGSQTRHDRTIEIVEMFEERNPGVSIEYEFSNWDGYWDKVAPQAAAGNLPDIFQHDYQYLKQYVDKDLMLSLQPYVDNGVIDLSNCAVSEYDGAIVNGELYAVSLGSNVMCVYYSPKLFEQGEIPVPTDDWTWEQYMDIARQIKTKLNIYADTGFPGGYDRGFAVYLREFGQNLYSEDGTELGFTDPKYFIDYFTMDVTLVKEGALPTYDVRNEIKSVEDQLLAKGQAAMFSQGQNSNALALMNATDDPLEIVQLPHSPDRTQPGNYVKNAQYMSIPKNSKYPDIAATFINFMTNDLEANKVLMGERGVPISSAIRDGLRDLIEAPIQKSWAYMDVTKNDVSPISPPDPQGQAEVVALLLKIHTDMTYGTVSVEDGAQSFMSEANAILSKNK